MTPRDENRTLPADVTLADDAIERESVELERVWQSKPGLWGWLTTVDHKAIGRRYIVTAFLMFIAGGIEAAFMRTQLARPGNTLLGPDKYNQIFTTHGTTMMFLFAVPMMTAMGTYFVPLMVGARSIACRTSRRDTASQFSRPSKPWALASARMRRSRVSISRVSACPRRVCRTMDCTLAKVFWQR